MASKAYDDTLDPTGGEVSFLSTLAFSLWWWIVGVPNQGGDNEQKMN
jgi:hypothetical protein